MTTFIFDEISYKRHGNQIPIMGRHHKIIHDDSHKTMVCEVGHPSFNRITADLIRKIESFENSLQGLVNRVVSIEEKLDLLKNFELPIGVILEFNFTVTAQNVFVLMGYGDWQKFGRGRVTIAEGSLTENNIEHSFVVGETGGEVLHVMTQGELPNIQIKLDNCSTMHEWIGNRNGKNRWDIPNTDPANNERRGEVKTEPLGDGSGHNNLPPFIVVQRWVRVS